MFPEIPKRHVNYYQGLADSLGLSFNGMLGVRAKEVRTKPTYTERPAPKIVPKPATVPSVAPPDALPCPTSTAFRWASCVHEAGHVVGALVVGARVNYASVTNGGVTWRKGAPDDVAEAVVIYCGPICELLLCPGDDPFSRKAISEPGGDMFRLIELGLSSAALSTARATAVNVVCEYRTAIGRIANVLAARGFIDGTEAAKLFAAK